ncbi:MAG: hypothetical protein AVDCRST_MAG89-4338, partial [uncultured Gemmatimonadetes bacterium]
GARPARHGAAAPVRIAPHRVRGRAADPGHGADGR